MRVDRKKTNDLLTSDTLDKHADKSRTSEERRPPKEYMRNMVEHRTDKIWTETRSFETSERTHRAGKRKFKRSTSDDEESADDGLGEREENSRDDINSKLEYGDCEEDIEIDGWRASHRNQSYLKSKAKRLLTHCETVGRDLRYHLSRWGASSNGATDEAPYQSNFCTGLCSIENSNSHNGDNDVDGYNCDVLSSDYFGSICPGLILKGYQLVGVNWLKLLHENRINGILADDMGLGKTVQSIAFLGWLKTLQTHPSRVKVHLIVVPASTLSNWQNELRRFCPSLAVITYHGSQDDRADIRYDLRGLLESGKVDILLSTFTIFERDSGKIDRSFLCKQKFEYLIIDEAHCLKVPTSSRFLNLNEIRSVHRLLLSGTPVQNDLSELLALMSFIMPDIFRKVGIDEILEGFGWDRKSNLPLGSSNSVSINQLRAMLAPFVLRRVKSDVLDQLVDKVSILEMVQMTDFQSKVYDDILTGHARRKERLKMEVAESIAEDAVANGKRKKKGNKLMMTADASILGELVVNESDCGVSLQTVVEGETGCRDVAEKVVRELSASEAAHLFTALRKAANHPLLLRVRYRDLEVMEKIADVAYAVGRFGNHCNLERVQEELQKFSDFDLHQLCLEFPDALGHLRLDAEVLYDSPKMQKLKGMLPELLADGHRILIFSQWTRLLDLLEVLLDDINVHYLRLDGSTPVKDRQELIDEFSHECSTIPVFLLSTKAGGLGINLTAADTVIMHDLDFNPENDRQAEDRCHRIGQTKAVRVHRLVTADTVDEDIFRMGERKRKLTAAVLADNHTLKDKATNGVLTDSGEVSDCEIEGDIGVIGRILIKALQRNKQKNAQVAHDTYPSQLVDILCTADGSQSAN